MITVGIIGGGITGLTTAFCLRQKGIATTVYEAGSRAGGIIQTVRHAGFLAEAGPHAILETSPRIAALVNELGLREQRCYSESGAGKRFIVRGGRPLAMPSSPWEWAVTPLFSLRGRIRILEEPFIRRAPPGCEESVADFVRRRLGPELLEYAVDPLVAGIFAGDPKRLSLRHAFPKLYALERRYGSLLLGQALGAGERKRRAEISLAHAKKFSFDRGLEVLPETLAVRLGDSIRFNAPVRALRQSPHGWRLGAGPQIDRDHSAIVYAGPAFRLPEIQPDNGCYHRWAQLRDLAYSPVATVTLGFRRADVRHPLDGFGMLVPGCEPFKILGTVFASSLFPNRAPEDFVLLTSYVGGARAPALALRGADELTELTRRDLRLLLGVEGDPVYRRVTIFPNAIPQYELGFDRYRRLMDDLETRAPGVFLAGNYRDGISVADSILSGFRTADRVEAFLAPRLEAVAPGPALMRAAAA